MPKQNSDRYGAGMKTRRADLGETHAESVEATTQLFHADFPRPITDCARGNLASYPGLTKRDRSLVTIWLLAVLGHRDEAAMHVPATKSTEAMQRT